MYDGKRPGKYKWVVWGVLCLAYMVALLHRLSIGTVKDDLTQAFQLSATAFANLGSVYFYAYLVMQIPTGILVDTLGPKITVIMGCIVAGAGSILFGMSQGYYPAFAGRFLVGIGVSVIYISTLKIITEWFSEGEFATISGLTSFIGNIGGVLAQTPLVLLVAFLTWRYTFEAIGVFTLILAVLCAVFVRNRPAGSGTKQIGMDELLKKEAEKASISKAFQHVCKNPYSWCLFLVAVGFHGAFQSFIGVWGQNYLERVYGIGKVSAANYMAIAVIGFALASFSLGMISDAVKRRKLIMVTIGALCLLSWCMVVFINGAKPPIEYMKILVFLIGFSTGGFMLCFTLIKEINDPRYAGVSISFVNTGSIAGAALVPVIIGWLMDAYGGSLSVQQLFSRALTVCLVSVGIGFVFMLFIKETRCRNIYNA